MYVEGDVPYVANGGYGNNGFGFGNGWEGLIGLALVAGLFGGWGGNGFGFGGRGVYGAGSEALGYELGKVATTNDVASGFTTNTILGVQRDQTLATQQGFANVQQTLCQGFNGINTALLQGFHGVDNSVCTLGYQNQVGFNQLSRELADCCCSTKGAIADLKYSNERQTCDILSAINGSTQKVIDYMQNEKIASLQAENVALKGRISNDQQSAYIIGALKQPCPVPAYVVPNPNCCYSACGGNGTSVI